MKAFFEPKSIALIGASRTVGKVGHSLWLKLKEWGGTVYPINPSFKLKSVKDVPGEVDLAVIAVPAPIVPAVVDECVAKSVKGIIVISAGFEELGAKGVKLAAPAVPLLGPNCFGLANPKLKLDLSFAKTPPPRGNIGLISQSGALASYLFNWAKDEKLGFSKYVSLGNRLGLNENKFLKYLGDDPETKVIGIYLESFAQGEFWLKIASAVSKKKPVIVLFAGQTEAGARASQSHTASLSPSSAVVETALKQSGCLQAKTVTDFTNLLEVFSLEPQLKDNDLAIVTNAGGPAILATDTASTLNLDVGKPIDVLGDADAAKFQAGIDLALKDKTNDSFLIIITPQTNIEIETTCVGIVKRFKHLNKPVVVSLLAGALSAPSEALLRKNKIATIDLPQDAAASLAALLKFYRGKKHAAYPVRRPYTLKVKKLTFPKPRLSWQEAEKLCRGYDISLVKTKRLFDPVKPGDWSWPLVVKADPAASVHRTEDKAIYLNIKSASALKLAYDRLKNKFPVILAQEQMKEGHELFISLHRSQGWPPLLTLGGGGIYTELYQDISRVFLPVNGQVVESVLAQTRIGQILAGFRTGVKLLEPTVKLILRCCHLFEECPNLAELEINPAIVSEKSLTVVDLKVTSGTLPEV